MTEPDWIRPPDPSEVVVGLENLTYQGDSLFKDMASIIEALRSQQRFTQKGVDRSDLAKAILDRTGMRIEFVITDTPILDAGAVPPYVNPNHVFYKTIVRLTAAQAFEPGFKKLKGERSGWVDGTLGKVGGWYSDLTSYVFLSTGFDREDITSEMISAVVLHELGHIWSYFLDVDKSILDVSIVSRTVKEASGIKDPMKRRDIIIYGMKQMDIDVVDPEALANKYDGKNVGDLVTLMYLDAKLRPQEVAADKEYSQRTWEQLSDHFAVMHGAATNLAAAIVSIHGINVSKYTQSNGVFFGIEALKFLLSLVVPIVPPLLLIYMYFDDAPLTYDALPKRLKLMRQTLIGEIKANFNNVKMIKKLHEDIALIEELEKSIYDRRTLYDIIQSTIVPRIRRMDKQTHLRTVVEGLIYNDLFTAAVKLK